MTTAAATTPAPSGALPGPLGGRRLGAVRRAAGGVFAVAAGAGLALQAARGRALVGGVAWPARPGLVLLAVALLAGVLAWGVFTWHRVLAHVGGGDGTPPVSFARLLGVWARANPARWLPGGVWQVAAVGALAPPTPQARVQLLAALVVHTGFSLAGAALVAAVTLPGRSAAWAAGAALAGAALAHPWLPRLGLRVAARLAGTPAVAWRATWRDGVRLLALHVASWVGYGAAFSLLVRGVADAAAVSPAPLTGAACLAFLVGYAAVVTPAGLGVREVALAALLAPALGPAAPGVAVLARLWSLAAECALAIAVLLGAAGARLARRGAGGRRAGGQPG